MPLISNMRSRILKTATQAWYRAGGAPAPVAAYQPKGAASLAASYINLANPGTNNAAPGTAPTFAAATGWTFAAASLQYLTTGIAPASGYTAIIRVANISNGGLAFGIQSASNPAFGILPNVGSVARYYSGGNAQKSPTATSGVFAIAGQLAYRNGIDEGLSITAWGGVITQAVTIGARRREDTSTIDAYLSGDVLAFAIYNTTLTPTQVTAVTAAMAAL